MRRMETLLHQYVGAVNGPLEEKPDKAMLLAHASRFIKLPFSFMTYYGSTDIHSVLEAMLDTVKVVGVKHVVIDNLQFMMTSMELRAGSSGFEKFEEMDHAISLFRRFASDHNVHVTVVIHTRKEKDGERLGISSFYGSSKPTQEADSVLILQKGLDGTRSLDLVKNRFDGSTGQVPLGFDPFSRSFFDKSVEPSENLVG
jgi:twinkle protein